MPKLTRPQVTTEVGAVAGDVALTESVPPEQIVHPSGDGVCIACSTGDTRLGPRHHHNVVEFGGRPRCPAGGAGPHHVKEAQRVRCQQVV